MSRCCLTLLRRGMVVAAALVAGATGCSFGEPRTVSPAGVDGLEIPTPSPDPADFVDDIDNPYLPLAPGSVWIYDSVGTLTTEPVTVRVSGERTIAGVTATEVTTVVDGPSGSTTSTDYYAQDDDGNVWSVGGEGWEAGIEGAQAGLVMPATPRVGDGFQQQYAAGVAEGRAQVLDTTASASTPYGPWTGLVEVLETSGPSGSTETRRFYADGVGLVLSETAAATTELVTFETALP